MVLYDEEIIEEGGGSVENPVDINETLQSLQESISRLNENLEKATEEESEEEITEEVTEEVTEEPIPEEELPLQKKDMDNLGSKVDKLSDNVDKLVKIQETAAENNADSSLSSLVIKDETVDTHLYLTSEVEGADLNDIYTMSLSIRNVLVLAFLIFLSITLFKLVRTGLERMLNR